MRIYIYIYIRGGPKLGEQLTFILRLNIHLYLLIQLLQLTIRFYCVQLYKSPKIFINAAAQTAVHHNLHSFEAYLLCLNKHFCTSFFVHLFLEMLL